jgi:hypothetical protein
MKKFFIILLLIILGISLGTFLSKNKLVLNNEDQEVSGMKNDNIFKITVGEVNLEVEVVQDQFALKKV